MKTLITTVLILIALTISAQENHINPYRDTLEIARYPLTNAEVLNSIADSTTKHFNEEKSMDILKALIINPNSSDLTLNNIAFFLTQQNSVNQDLLLTLASHKNISQKTINNILIFIEGKSGLETLNEFCYSKLKF